MNGWEPTSTTTTVYEYDDDGRLIASVATTVREPEFEQFDRENFDALADLKADTCPGCSGLLSETTVDDGHSYDIDHTTCFRCAALRMRQDELQKKADKAHKGEYGYPIGPGNRPLIISAELWSARRIPPD